MRLPTRRTTLLVAILLLAAVLRLGWPALTEYKFDEALTYGRGLRLAQLGVLPRGTVSSVPGVPQPPLKAYVIAPPLVVWPDPVAAVLWLSALGVGAVYLTYRLGMRLFGEAVGLLAAALYAAAPWAVFFERKLWAQDVPLISLLFVSALAALVIERRGRALAAVIALLGVVLGLYTGNAVYAIFLAAVLLAFAPSVWRIIKAMPPRLRWRRLALGLAGLAVAFALAFGPHLGELRQRVEAFRAAGDAIPSAAQGAGLFDHIRAAAQAATGWQYHALAGEGWREFRAALPVDLAALDVLDVLLILIGMFYVPLRAAVLRARGKYHAPYTLLALWLWVPVLTWVALGMSAELHRYAPLYPAQHLAAALVLGEGLRCAAARISPCAEKAALALAAGLVVVIVGWQGVTYGTMLRTVSGAAGDAAGGHAQPAREMWQAAREARQLAAGEDLPVVVYTAGMDPATEHGAAEWDALLGDLPLVLAKRGSITVEPPTAYVQVDDAGDVYTVAPKPAPSSAAEPGVARFANGLDLLGGSPVEDESGTLSVELRWRVWSASAAGALPFATVRLAGAQHDGPLLPPGSWQDGMLITSRHPLGEVQPGGGPLTVGLYTFGADGQLAGVDFLDAAGNPAGQLVELPLPSP